MLTSHVRSKCLTMRRAVVRLYGIVQGVGMRYYVWREARKLGLGGYVRNLDDGSVEFVVEGDEEAIEELISRVRDEGPGFITDVKVVYEDFRGEFKDFRIIH